MMAGLGTEYICHLTEYRKVRRGDKEVYYPGGRFNTRSKRKSINQIRVKYDFQFRILHCLNYKMHVRNVVEGNFEN